MIVLAALCALCAPLILLAVFLLAWRIGAYAGRQASLRNSGWLL